MNDFLENTIVGTILGLMLGFIPHILLANFINTAVHKNYKHAHCKQIDSRAEYQKCFDEFKPVEGGG